MRATTPRMAFTSKLLIWPLCTADGSFTTVPPSEEISPSTAPEPERVTLPPMAETSPSTRPVTSPP